MPCEIAMFKCSGICDSLLRSHKASVLMKEMADAKTPKPTAFTIRNCVIQAGLIPLILRQVILSFSEDWLVILHRNVLPKVDEHLHNQWNAHNQYLPKRGSITETGIKLEVTPATTLKGLKRYSPYPCILLLLTSQQATNLQRPKQK